MSNPVTKLPNNDNQPNQNANRTAGNSTGGSRAVNVSAGQGREIFGQVNINLQQNSHHSSHEKEKNNGDKNESKTERQDRQTIHQGKDSAEKAEKRSDRNEKINNSADRKSQTDAKNTNQSTLPSNNSRSAKSQNQSSAQTASNQDQNLNLPGAKQSAQSNNIANRININAQNQSVEPTRKLNLTLGNYSTINNQTVNAPGNNSNSIDVQLNNFLGEAVRQIFRENDVYLTSRAVNILIEHHDANNTFRLNDPALNSLSKEIFRLVEIIENQVLNTSLSPRFSHQHAFNQVTVEVPQNLEELIRSARNLLNEIFGTDEVKHFSRLDIEQRMLAAIEIFIKDSPAGLPKNLRDYSAKEILAGFLLARGLLNSGNGHSTANLIEMMRSAATNNISLTGMRDFGALIKVLISDAAAAKSNANLETAVQKFARILIAVNRLDAVLTAVKLASQSQFTGEGAGKTLAIAQVDELINRLVLAGGQAMKEAAEVVQKNAAKNEPNKNTRSVFPSGTIADLVESDAVNQKNTEPKTIAAESVLRQFLEFNPMFAQDKCLSAFANSDDARQAQNYFLDHHQIEIEQWLQSGNHRLVKDIDFEKPLGIVVERGANDFLSAATARIVLVRDGSAQGWHFLKSFLVA